MLADLDNTLVPYGVTEPPEEIVAWKQALEAQGIQLSAVQQPQARPGPEASPSGWASPIRGTPASPGGRAISGPWSAWGAGRRRRSWWATRSSPTPWGPTTPGWSPCWWSPSGWRATRGAISAMRRRPPSACWAKAEALPMSARFGPAGNSDSFFQGPQVLPGRPPGGSRAGAGLL